MVRLSFQGTQLLEEETQGREEPDPHWGLKISTIPRDSETLIYNSACSSCWSRTRECQSWRDLRAGADCSRSQQGKSLLLLISVPLFPF